MQIVGVASHFTCLHISHEHPPCTACSSLFLAAMPVCDLGSLLAHRRLPRRVLQLSARGFQLSARAFRLSLFAHPSTVSFVENRAAHSHTYPKIVRARPSPGVCDAHHSFSEKAAARRPDGASPS